MGWQLYSAVCQKNSVKNRISKTSYTQGTSCFFRFWLKTNPRKWTAETVMQIIFTLLQTEQVNSRLTWLVSRLRPSLRKRSSFRVSHAVDLQYPLKNLHVYLSRGGGTLIWKGWGCSTETWRPICEWPNLFWPSNRYHFINFDYINRVNKTKWKYIFLNISSRATLKETLTANNDVCPEHPKWDQNQKFTPLSETTSIPAPFIWDSTPGLSTWCS